MMPCLFVRSKRCTMEPISTQLHWLLESNMAMQKMETSFEVKKLTLIDFEI